VEGRDSLISTGREDRAQKIKEARGESLRNTDEKRGKAEGNILALGRKEG